MRFSIRTGPRLIEVRHLMRKYTFWLLIILGGFEMLFGLLCAHACSFSCRLLWLVAGITRTPVFTPRRSRRRQTLVGTYVLEAFHLPRQVGSARPLVVVELHADGTFLASNVPPDEERGPGTNFFATLLSGAGRWEKGTVGTLDPGLKMIWGIYLRTTDNRFSPASFTGAKPPYGLIFTLGDPDSGHAVILKRKP